MKKKLTLVLLVAGMILLGYFREYVFVGINLDIQQGSASEYSVAVKWMLTVVFSIVYLLITCILLWVLFQKKQLLWIGIYAYVFCFGIACLSVVIGYFFNTHQASYHFARIVMGIAQSPVVAMLLIPFCLLEKHFSVSNK